jgi:hypothetical protein
MPSWLALMVVGTVTFHGGEVHTARKVIHGGGVSVVVDEDLSPHFLA